MQINRLPGQGGKLSLQLSIEFVLTFSPLNGLYYMLYYRNSGNRGKSLIPVISLRRVPIKPT
jgi:hypothetical protein